MQKTAYELRISDWSSDVCSSDLRLALCRGDAARRRGARLFRRRRPQRSRGARSARAGRVFVRIAQGDDAVDARQIGRASCRERVCQYVYISVVAGSLKKKQPNDDLLSSALTITVIITLHR